MDFPRCSAPIISARRMTITRVHAVLITWSLLQLIIIDNFGTQAREPRNITRAESEIDVFIPCPFEFRPSPSIWRINGTEYISATLPPVYTQTSGGLFINRVDKCLNHTSFQCIDTSDDSLQGQESNIGFLTVTSQGKQCTEDDAFFRVLSPETIELDHQRIVYGNINTTLAWINTAESSSCNISQILSHLPCQSRNTAALDIITTETEAIVLSENLRISGYLADFNISSSNDQVSATEECPVLSETIRVNVTQTKKLNLLVGNNNCTCVDIECQGSLYVAISKPDTMQPDVICPIYVLPNTMARSCYNPDGCKQFNGTPFFSICELPASTGCTYNMCFSNITEELNGTRLDFFVLNRTVCDSEPPYLARIYVLSFKINARNASANISVDTTVGEICFYSSPQECSLTRLTHYNVFITDLTGNVIFIDETIPESSCVSIQEVLFPQCYPYSMSIQPLNNFITYNSVDQLITDDAGNTGDICSCINETVKVLSITMTALHQNSFINISYLCSTVYLTQLNIMVIVSAGNRTLHQQKTVCSAGNFSLNSSLYQCSQVIDLNGYWTLTDTNGTSSNCSLFNHSVSISCPTVSPTPNSESGTIATVVSLLLVTLTIIISLTVVLYLLFKFQNRETRVLLWLKMQQFLHRENRQDKTNATNDSEDKRDGAIDNCSDNDAKL